MLNGSPSFNFDVKADGARILKGALMAAIGALLTYLTQEVGHVDFGPLWTPVIVAGWSVVANAVRVWFSDTTEPTLPPPSNLDRSPPFRR